MVDRPYLICLTSLSALALAACAPTSVATAPAAPTAAPVASAPAAAHERLVALDAGVNFRDLGGYATSDGRYVLWGRVFRSGSMARLTPHDIATLRRLGIRSVHDYRSTSERTAEPFAWTGDDAPHIFARDYTLDMREFLAALGAGGGPITPEHARAVTAQMYRQLPFNMVENYRSLFADLAVTDGAVVMNCSAGKDRTGLGSALFLLALHVPRETVLADYLLSNRYYRPTPTNNAANAMLHNIPPEVLAALTGVDASYLNASLDAIIERYGSIDAYLEQALGVTPAMRAALIAKYTSATPN
ncbi:MAG: tyrosine-protein phosphatase [Sphingomonadaceae bacterium]|nr:tyrosine-protein phosphatase [Sphingomonadaceae bacterium]